MRYFGSKTTTLNSIRSVIEKMDITGIVCDPFGGIGTVGAFLKANNYSIVCGDVLTFAYCFQIAKVGINNKLDIPNLDNLKEINNILNNLKGCDGWLVQYYANERKYFTIENAKKIQSCINAIWKWHQDNQINDKEYCLLIASLINSIDKVANTAGTYYAYLKEFNRKSIKSFNFELIEPTFTDNYCDAFLIDAYHLVQKIKCDILYLDPPYNDRNYSQYYHLPEVIATKTIPNPRGKSGIHHLNYKRSKFTQKVSADEAFCQLVNKATCEYIIFHYSDSGLIPKDLIMETLLKKGKVFDIYCDSRGYSVNKEKKYAKHHIYGVECQ